MNAFLYGTLVDIAVLNVAVLLFNNSEIREQLTNGNDWNEELHDFMNDKTSELFLPPHLQERVIALCPVIGRNLKHKNEQFVTMHASINRQLGLQCQCFEGILHLWTPMERYFDKRKTIQALVQNQNIDLAFRFSLACINCLQDSIVTFWEQMPQTLKDRFFQHNLPNQVRYWVKLLLFSEDSTYKNPTVNFRETIRRTLQSFQKDPSLKSKFQNQPISEWKCHPELAKKIGYVPGIGRRWFRGYPEAYHDSSTQSDDISQS